MKKKLLTIFVCGIMLIGLTGCGATKEESNKDTKEEKTTSTAKKDTKVFEYIEKLDLDNSVDEITEMIGLEPKVEEESSYNKYTWTITDYTSLIALEQSSGSVYNIKVETSNDIMKNKKVDFSKYDEIQAALKSGNSLTYDEFVEKVGNVQGYLIEKSSISTAYKWVSDEGAYLRATFNNTSKKCTFVSGRI